MTLKQQKIISGSLIALVVLGGFEALIYIVNLNQPAIFVQVAFVIYLYLSIKITLLYDLHFKNPGALARARARHESVSHWLVRSIKIVFSALGDRFYYLGKKQHFFQFQNYLILPGLLFWPTVIFFYIEMGNTRIQHIFAVVSSAALIINYWYLKEAFLRKSERVDQDIFVALSAIKIYAAALTFGAALVIMRRFCLEPWQFMAAVFSLTFLLVYQALFQHKLFNLANALYTTLISLLQASVGYFVYLYWGYNFFTAAIFMAAIYNLMWNTFHFHLDKKLYKRFFLEILLVSAIIALMVFSVTNFKAQILGGCGF